MSTATPKANPESAESMAVDETTMRLMIALVALLLPLFVFIKAAFTVSDSISWSYHTPARDIFVGSLAIIGCALICYKGHKPNPIDINDKTSLIECIWLLLKGEKPFLILWDDIHRSLWRSVPLIFRKRLDTFRQYLRDTEEDKISSLGGVAAWVAALSPTASCINTPDNICPWDWGSSIHQFCAIVLFGTTIYFCLVAFRRRAQEKIDDAQDKIDKAKNKVKIENDDDDYIKKAYDVIIYAKRRMLCYGSFGLAILIIMVGLIVLTTSHWLTPIKNLTFGVETFALLYFSFAWLIASHLFKGLLSPPKEE